MHAYNFPMNQKKFIRFNMITPLSLRYRKKCHVKTRRLPERARRDMQSRFLGNEKPTLMGRLSLKYNQHYWSDALS